MKRYDRLKQILDEAIGGESIGAHGAFWRPLSREEFLLRKVFGRAVVTPGDPDASTIVKAVEGRAPFGSDTGTVGATFRRMPAGLPPLPAEHIAFLRSWISDGCPDDEFVEPAPHGVEIDVSDRPPLAPEKHLAFWRDFDNWAMFESTPEVEAAVGAFFGAAPEWMRWAGGTGTEAAWSAAIAAAEVRGAIASLAIRQADTLVAHYGTPVRLSEALDSFEDFGGNRLPDDPLRPQDPRHNMNGPQMWFFWSAFTDACLRLGIGGALWTAIGRCVLLGLLSDGLFRGRFTVRGFTADAAGRTAARAHAKGLEAARLSTELARRCAESGFGAPP